MSTEYKTVTDRLIAILDAESGVGDALSENLTRVELRGIHKGQFMPTSMLDKPMVFVRLQRAGLVVDMAGGLRRQERLMFLISGASEQTTQEAAFDEATNLCNNVQRVLANYPSDDGVWGAGRFGWDYSDDDESAEPIAEFIPDVDTNRTVVHFKLLWSCDVSIATEAL